eukprot:Ihof_evm4s64 gene=Ihof_evmTU4s64
MYHTKDFILCPSYALIMTVTGRDLSTPAAPRVKHKTAITPATRLGSIEKKKQWIQLSTDSSKKKRPKIALEDLDCSMNESENGRPMSIDREAEYSDI